MASVKKTQKKEKLNKKTIKATPSSKKAPLTTSKKPAPKKSTSTKNSNTKSLSSTAALSKTSTNQKFYDQLKLSESYVSLILGAIVVVGVSVLFLFFLREARNPSIPKPEVLNTSVSPVLTKVPDQKYTMGGK